MIAASEVALADAVKGVAMFRKVGVPVLGIVENMSYFLCSHCGERTEIFGHGGGKSQSERLGAPFLGEIPLDPGIREGGDAGSPASASEATPLAAAFDAVADRVRDALTEDDSGASAREGFFSRFRRNRDER